MHEGRLKIEALNEPLFVVEDAEVFESLNQFRMRRVLIAYIRIERVPLVLRRLSR